jgi:hypothetical protein
VVGKVVLRMPVWVVVRLGRRRSGGPTGTASELVVAPGRSSGSRRDTWS